MKTRFSEVGSPQPQGVSVRFDVWCSDPHFNDRDTELSPRVALVNGTFACDFCGRARDTKYANPRETAPPEVFGTAQQYPVEGSMGSNFHSFIGSNIELDFGGKK